MIRQPTLPGRQSGVALITALIILLVITLIGISGMDETILEDRMSLGFRDRAVADNAAESSIRSAETWLSKLTSKPTEQTTSNCSTPPLCGATSGYVVWSTTQLYASPKTVADLVWSDFTSMAVEYKGTGSTASKVVGAKAQPRTAIEYLSFNPADSQGRVVQMDANKASLGVGPYYYRVIGAGQGYRQETMAVVESTFRKWF